MSVRLLMAALAEAALTIAESDDSERLAGVADGMVTNLIDALTRRDGS